MKQFTILFAGLGSIGQRHLRNLLAVSPQRPRLLAYRTRRDDRIFTDDLRVEAPSGLEQKYGIETFADLTVALQQQPDIVFVTNPTSRHLEVALAAARAGCHLFLEKPVSHNWTGVEELLVEMKNSGRVGYVGYQFRFHPAFEAIVQCLKEGRIGRIAAVRAEVGEYLPAFHRYEDYRETYPARADLGGGVVLCQIHEYDLLYALFGLPAEACAMGGRASRLEIDVEDTAQVLFRYRRDDGATLAAHVHQDFLQQPPRRNFQIIGDAGSIWWDYLGKTLQISGPDAPNRINENYANLPRNHMFMAEMRHFLACVEGRESPRVGLPDGVQSLRMALAVKQSLATGLIVPI